jgi:hypothetical protein
MPLTEYHVTGPGPVNVLSGQVRLTAGQAIRREHALRPVDNAPMGAALRALQRDREVGVYEAVKPLQFKPGETFAWDGIPPKERAAAVVEIGEDGEAKPVYSEAGAKAGQEPAEDETKLQKQVEALGVEYQVKPIRETLDELEVEYPGNAKKAELGRILVQNVEPDSGGEGAGE